MLSLEGLIRFRLLLIQALHCAFFAGLLFAHVHIALEFGLGVLFHAAEFFHFASPVFGGSGGGDYSAPRSG